MATQNRCVYCVLRLQLPRRQHASDYLWCAVYIYQDLRGVLESKSLTMPQMVWRLSVDSHTIG